MIRELGVSGPQRVVLRLVTEAGELGPSEIADRTMHHPATVSTLLRRLEERGYVERRESEVDGRRTVVVATERGRALGAVTEGTIEAAVASVIARLPPEDIAACLRVVDALARELAPGLRPPGPPDR